ncbi:MAG: nucleoside deaminase [Chloroflexi bacterium]|nr:nucleoside deaminase [Chloroflexota bacterium]
MTALQELFIRKTFDLARQAAQNGDHPFGALLVKDGKVVMTAVNTVNSSRDNTRHAELNLVSQAMRQFDADFLADCALYTSTEPCAMCAGAIYWAGITAVVYGCSAEKLGEIAGGSFVIPCREIFSRGRQTISVTGPILETEGAAIHEGFW